MHDGHSENAMTEIALALAMGFFSLMVLTLVSMGAGPANTTEAVATQLARPAENTRAEARTQLMAEDLFIIYHNGQILNRNLKPADLESMDLAAANRTILAMAPDIPLSEAMSVRGRIGAKKLIVTTLDERWLTALKRHSHEN